MAVEEDADDYEGGNQRLRPDRACLSTYGRLGRTVTYGSKGLMVGYSGWAVLTVAGAVANSVWAYRVYRTATR